MGCSSIPPKYSISEDVSVTLNNLRAIKNKISVGQFMTNPDITNESFWCRGQVKIEAPNNTTYSDYIRRAFITELRNAQLYDQNATIILTGNIESLNVSSIIGVWDISIQLTSSNGKSIVAKDRVEFSPGIDTIAACDRVANNFMTVTQGVLGKLVNNPNFKELLYENILISPVQNDLLEVKSQPNSAISISESVEKSQEPVFGVDKEHPSLNSATSSNTTKQINISTKEEKVLINKTKSSGQTTSLPVPSTNKNTLSKIPDCIGEYNSITWTECNGKKIDSNGISYIGTFKNGKENGFGTRSYPDGRKFVGYFKMGYRTSIGKEYDAQGNLTEEFK